MKKKKSGALTTIFVILIFVVGLSLLLYPTVSDYWNSIHQSQVIVSYDKEVNELEQAEFDRLWAEAEAFNSRLLTRPNRYVLSEADKETYYSTLVTSEKSLMAYLEIPVIDCMLPVRHGTEDDVLQKSVGHIEWTSLPVGGKSSHCVLSGHRGLPSSELLTNIDHMQLGDRFYLHVLGETLEYKVDNIAVVEPNDLNLLGVEEGKDYVTLLTCTPYGINSHRLLVRGIRVDGNADLSGAPDLTNEVREIDIMYIVPAVLVGLIVVVFLWLLIDSSRKKKARKKKEEETIAEILESFRKEEPK